MGVSENASVSSSFFFALSLLKLIGLFLFAPTQGSRFNTNDSAYLGWFSWPEFGCVHIVSFVGLEYFVMFKILLYVDDDWFFVNILGGNGPEIILWRTLRNKAVLQEKHIHLWLKDFHFSQKGSLNEQTGNCSE